jgi:phytoene synthase
MMSGDGTPQASSNFFVAFRVLSPERRKAIRAVYGFCRRADDAVDQAPDGRVGRLALDRVVAELDRLFATAPPRGPSDPLREAVERFSLPRKPFDDLLEGVSWDLEGRRYDSVEDLRQYCYRVASTVGLLCVRIFGCRGESCDPYARELGVALQWTNILRDIGSDLARGRVYLPSSALAGHGLTPDDLTSRDPAVRDRIAALVRREAAYARHCFAEAERVRPVAERPKLLAAEIMAGVYRQLLHAVERAGDRVLSGRITVSGPRRGWIALRLLLGHRLAYGFRGSR